MRWFGKAIGAAIGMVFGNVPGAALGALLGHQFDRGLGDPVSGNDSRARQIFFEVTFEVMGQMAKLDGRVSEEEIRAARRIMHSMKLDPDQVQQAIQRFNFGKQADYPMRQRLEDLSSRIGRRSDLGRAFVEIQVRAAVGSGEVTDSKRQLLWQIARLFGFSRVELAQIEAVLHGQAYGGASAPSVLDLEVAYRTLGVGSGASDGEVKTAYRRLMNQHHPDKLVAKGLPESMAEVAEQRTLEIRAAYDRIKSERGFS